MTELIQAFEETDYIVFHQPNFTLRVGQNSTELDTLLNESGFECAVFITAWNPMSQPLSQERNLERQHNLLVEIQDRGFSTLPGIGQHPSNEWPGEESILVIGMQLEIGKALALAFGQLAFVYGEKGCRTRLIETKQ